METQRYIDEELALIDPNYFAVFDEVKGRWRVQKWDSHTRRRNWRIHSQEILTVKKEDKQGNDIGYCDIDMRTVRAMRVGFYYARNAIKLLREIDEANDKMVRNLNAEQDYQIRAGAKRVWHYYQEPTVYLNQKYGR